MSNRTDAQPDAALSTTDLQQLLDLQNFGAAAPSGSDFDERYHSLLRAQAALQDPHGSLDDAARDVLHATAALRETIFLATPSAHNHQVLKKFRVVSEIVADELATGITGGPRILIAMASLQQDLFKFLGDFV